MAGRRGALKCGAAAALAAAALLAPAAAVAQFGLAGGPQPSRNQPVTFRADSVEYQQNQQLVIARGHVEAWQNGQVLRADEVTFNRRTGIAIARGHVTLFEPNGDVLFADEAQLSQGMRDAVMRGLRARLAQNARLAANGGRRTAGVLNSLAKVVYSTCNLCKKNPYAPPLWQIRAGTATEDLQHQRMEYTNAEMQMFGVPIAYFPFFWTPLPSAKRASGLLMPSFGTSSHIGAFYSQPYYWVIDNQSDATFTPMLTTEGGPELGLEYRRRFNFGYFSVDATGAYWENTPQYSIYLNGIFDLTPTWRAGFNINKASSANYVDDFHLLNMLAPGATVLSSNIYLEGFGEGAYSRLDVRSYQGLTTTVPDSELPIVLPHYQYSYFGQPDALGGRLSVDTDFFNVMRTDGTDTRRGTFLLEWDRPFVGALGDLWTLKLHNQAAIYNASDMNEQPNYGTMSSVSDGRDVPAAALDFRWPFARYSGAWGTQLIEPMAELLVSPNQGASQINKYPNEDSLDFEFNDTRLFGFNRFGGIDRVQGGSRATLALHAAWYLGGTALDALIGQSYNTQKTTWLPETSGLHDNISDIVGHLIFTPTDWLDTSYRFRLDHRNLAMRMSDVTASVGGPRLRVTLGYLYTSDNPYYYYDQPQPIPSSSEYYIPRNEVTLAANTKWGDYRFDGFAQRDLARNQMIAVGADAIYEDECFIADLRFYRQYTNLNGQGESTTLLIQLTFKTIGQFGFSAL